MRCCDLMSEVEVIAIDGRGEYAVARRDLAQQLEVSLHGLIDRIAVQVLEINRILVQATSMPTTGVPERPLHAFGDRISEAVRSTGL